MKIVKWILSLLSKYLFSKKKRQEEKRKIDRVIDEASKESFPASDSPGWINKKEPDEKSNENNKQ